MLPEVHGKPQDRGRETKNSCLPASLLLPGVGYHLGEQITCVQVIQTWNSGKHLPSRPFLCHLKILAKKSQVEVEFLDVVHLT